MTDTQLRRMMHESAEEIPVSPPPLAAIARGARRRRAGMVGLAAAAVVLVAGAAVAVPQLSEGGHEVAPAGPAHGGDPGSSWDQGPNDVPLFLPTYGATAGESRGDTTLRGELRLVDQEQCVVVGAEATPVVWPRGYEGVVHPDGSFDLLDESRHQVARAGDDVALDGAWTRPAVYSGEKCLPQEQPGKVFLVMAEPRVTN